MKEQLLRGIAKVDELCRAPELAPLYEEYTEQAVTDAVRKVLGALRCSILAGEMDELPSRETICSCVAAQAAKDALPSLRPVINATGVILHTNLGRACLSEKASRAAADAAAHYSNLEYDLAEGCRGVRYSHVEQLLCRLSGAESALVVNNNAAAVLLVLSALAKGGEVVVSRGELVEIGGSFRVPEIMESCGARLKEVGTTNKTYLRDYENAITEETRALMKVHTSNYRIVGFSQSVSLRELVALGKERGLPVIEDLGSGSLLPLDSFGIHDEPTVPDSVGAGVDVVSFSGDKLLGGPQTGIIVGKKKYIDILKKHPLNRAMRVDKMTVAALEATLRGYESGGWKEIPTLAMLSASREELHSKAALLCAALEQMGVNARVIATAGQTGGGAAPTVELPSFAVAVEGDAQHLEKALRGAAHPVIGRIHAGEYLLDVRTLWQEDFAYIAEAVREALK